MEETVAWQLPLPEKSRRIRRFRQEACIKPIGGDYEASIQNPGGIRAENMGKKDFYHASRRRKVTKTEWITLEPATVRVLHEPKELAITLKTGTRFTR